MHARASRLAVTAIALVLVAQIGGAAHEAAVRHVACAHGELIEAPEIDASPSDESRFVAAGGGQADHEHCAVSSALRHHGTSATTAPAVTAAVAVIEIRPAEPVVARTDRAMYRIAPKTSPPVAVL